jgi:hypothetical protein
LQIVSVDSGDSNSTEDVRLEQPHVAVDGDNVYVTWADGRHAYIRTSHDGGATFGPATEIASSSRSEGQFGEVLLAASGSHVHVAWIISYGSQAGVYVRSSDDYGASFGPQIVLLENDDSGSWMMQIASSGENVYLAWQQNNPSGGSATAFVASRDGGASFDDPKLLGGVHPSSVAGPMMAAPSNSSDVYVMWQPYFGMALASSHDSGSTFEPNFELATGRADRPIVAAAGEGVYAVWSREADGGDYDTIFRASDDYGESFSEEIAILEGRDFIGYGMAAISGNAYLVLSSDEIYFMKVD